MIRGFSYHATPFGVSVTGVKHFVVSVTKAREIRGFSAAASTIRGFSYQMSRFGVSVTCTDAFANNFSSSQIRGISDQLPGFQLPRFGVSVTRSCYQLPAKRWKSGGFNIGIQAVTQSLTHK